MSRASAEIECTCAEGGEEGRGVGGGRCQPQSENVYVKGVIGGWDGGSTV